MAYIKQPQDCDCATCAGSGQPSNPESFGGWKCMCPCHDKATTPPTSPQPPEGQPEPRWHNPDNLPSAGEPPWRFLVEGEDRQEGDQFWADWKNQWHPVIMDRRPAEYATYRTRRPLPAPSVPAGQGQRPVQVPANFSADEANKKYGEAYGVDWVYAASQTMKHQQNLDLDTINQAQRLAEKCLNPDKFVALEELLNEVRASVIRRTSDNDVDVSVCHACDGTGYTQN